MMKQTLLEMIDEVNQKLEIKDDFLQYAYQIDGTRVKSFMDIHQNTRVLIVSNRKEFTGLKGLDKLQGFHDVKH